MKGISLAFFWHMHQPYYFNPVTRESVMPWVRMHATRGYFDLVSILGDYPALRQTFNYVPSLLKQIEQYNRGEVRDLCYEHTARPAGELTQGEREFILWNFFMVNWETMLKPYPRYTELLYARGASVTDDTLAEAARRFSERDVRDLQVWFNLTWFGIMACVRYPELKEYKKKGSGFSEEEKQRILEIQRDILKSVIPLHREAEGRGQIELTTSPFYHPIMPLLYDTDFARRAMPDVPLPARYHYPGDVAGQLAEAVRYHKYLFGKEPAGLWPPEGSVCPEIVPLVSDAGIRWMATDEEVLFRSTGKRDRGAVLYRPYRVEHGGKAVAMIFRDRELSDRIGFSYAFNEPKSAAADFLEQVAEIAKTAQGDQPLLSIILDGENPWQSYPDGGESFLRHLYEGLSASKFVTTVRVGEYLEAHPPRDTITTLHSGSWIDSNYGVWIGEEEDNVAWDLLGAARAAFGKKATSATPAAREKAREEINAAEGSDWFWWYGERFSSDSDPAFDELFRTHLKNVYAALGMDIPQLLNTPILHLGRVSVAEEPKAFLKPIIDGKESSYYEWVDAGKYHETSPDSTMCKSEACVEGIQYGFDRRNFYLRIDPRKKPGEHGKFGHRFHVHFNSPKVCRISFSLPPREGAAQTFELSHKNESGKYGTKTSLESIAADSIIELAVPFRSLGFAGGKEAHFYVQVITGKVELERHPRGGYIAFTVPDKEFELERWSAL
ncbi:MAG: glycoside hydrolase family 57 protein [Candidatus Aureabacteria bacterium]|nr:glycoside hydrolase family 57 protein [Candidatus Auribacterota bacterium]